MRKDSTTSLVLGTFFSAFSLGCLVMYYAVDRQAEKSEAASVPVAKEVVESPPPKIIERRIPGTSADCRQEKRELFQLKRRLEEISRKNAPKSKEEMRATAMDYLAQGDGSLSGPSKSMAIASKGLPEEMEGMVHRITEIHVQTALRFCAPDAQSGKLELSGSVGEDNMLRTERVFGTLDDDENDCIQERMARVKLPEGLSGKSVEIDFTFGRGAEIAE